MTKIKNIEDLREHAIEALERLRAGDIDTAEAGATGKLCENVISTCKAQIEYYRMLNEEPEIPFLRMKDDKRKVLGHEKQTYLPAKK